MQNHIATTYEQKINSYRSSKPLAKEYKEFAENWNYYKLIAELAGDNLLQFDAVLSRSVEEVYTFIIYKLEKEPAVKAQTELEKQISKWT